MTTTVCDLTHRIITADTRWSSQITLSDGANYFLFCDDTGFDKISLVGKTALVTAGNGILIAEWKKWWCGEAKAEDKPQTEIDGTNAVNIAIIDLSTSEVIFHAGQKHALYCLASNKVKAFTSGSGGFHAASDLLKNECAKSAIKFAANLDRHTGQEVVYICYKTNTNNLNTQQDDYNLIVNGLIKKGKIMMLEAENTVIKAEDIKDHRLKSEIEQKFATGQAVASAPVPGIGDFKWTEETDKKFEVAMDRVHALRNS
jgi:hypothetical protein